MFEENCIKTLYLRGNFKQKMFMLDSNYMSNYVGICMRKETSRVNRQTATEGLSLAERIMSLMFAFLCVFPLYSSKFLQICTISI